MYEDDFLEEQYEDRNGDPTGIGVDYDEPDFTAYWEDYNDSDDSDNECEDHESLNGADMGESVYCDGSCVTRDIPPGVSTSDMLWLESDTRDRS